MTTSLLIEQFVWGTFQFTDGFSVVAKSAGISDVVETSLVDICRSWGGIVADASFTNSLFHRYLSAGQDSIPAFLHGCHLVGKVIKQGRDYAGRDAHNIQILVLSEKCFEKIKSDCFVLERAGLFKDRWFQGDSVKPLDIDLCDLKPWLNNSFEGADVDKLESICTELFSGSRVRIRSRSQDPSFSRLFRLVINLLPMSVRGLVELSTFTFNSTYPYHLCVVFDKSSQNSDGDLCKAEILASSESGLGVPLNLASEGNWDFDVMAETFKLLRLGEYRSLEDLLRKH